MDGRKNQPTDRQMNGKTSRRMDGQMGQQTDRQTDGPTKQWMDHYTRVELLHQDKKHNYKQRETIGGYIYGPTEALGGHSESLGRNGGPR